MFIRFSVRVVHERLLNYVCASFPFSYDDGMWDLFVLVLIIAFYFSFPNLSMNHHRKQAKHR